MDFQGVREWHLHTYFDEKSPEAVERARAFRERILALSESGVFTARCLPMNMGPKGPHPVGSFETWVPMESFPTVFAFFARERGPLDIFVHALTVHEVRDHEEGAWMGQRLQLNLGVLHKLLPEVPKQHPELRLGYSAPL
jgi:DOPA 4,5-dioxygenase